MNVNVQMGNPQPQQYPPTNNQYNVVNNQTNLSAGEEMRLQDALRSHSQFLRCKCEYAGLTAVTKACSCGNVCCCIFTSPMCWIFFQACRGKDINCYDAQHICSKCGSMIGEYKAC